MFVHNNRLLNNQEAYLSLLECIKIKKINRFMYRQMPTLVIVKRQRCIGTRVDSRATPPSQGDEIFPTVSIRPRNFVRDLLTCMRARFKYIPAYDGGNSTSSCRHKAAACRVHGYGVQLVRSLPLSPSFSLCFYHLSCSRTPPWRRSYRALWSESWDRGLAGSHDRWGFGLTPLVWTESMVPPARGTALFLLLLTPLHPVFLFLHSSPILCLSLSFFRPQDFLSR